MLPLFNGRKVGADGKLSVLLRSAAIPASYQRSGGWAMDASGQPYIDTGDVAATRVMNQGIAFTPDGAMYVTSAAPSSTSIRIGGVAVSADGAVHYTVDAEPLSGGIGLSATGQISLGNEVSPWAFSEVLDYYDGRYGITEDVGVAAWAPTLKGTHTLVQAVTNQQPAWTDGNSVLFDGSNDVLKTASFTLEQPTTIVVCGKQITWASDDRWFDGNANDTGTIVQAVGSPQVRGSAGALLGAAGNSPALDTYAIMSCVFNGASSVVQLNLNTPTTGDAGAGDMNGLTLARYGASGVGYGNVQIKAVAVCNSALSTTRLNELIRAMNAQYGVF